MTYRRPILATDFSEGSEAATALARAVVDSGVQGVGIHVAPVPDIPRRVPPDVRGGLLESAERGRSEDEATVKEWLRRHGLPGWDAAIRYGPVGRLVADEAARREADVIIFGSTGAGRIERVLLGSAARSIMHHAPCDVLVARRPPPEGRIRRILVATDLQSLSEAAARRALALATRHGAALTAMHAIDPSVWGGALYPSPPEGRFDAEWLRKHVLDGLAEFNRSHLNGLADEVVVHGRAASAIPKKAAEIDADLVVVGSHGEGFASRVLLGSVAEAVAERAPSSALIVRR